MKEFVKEHPFLTFFLGLAAVDGVVEIVRILKRPSNAWPLAPHVDRGPGGLLSITRNCDCGPAPMFAAGAEAHGSCTPGFYFDPATGNCVPFPGTPPYGEM